MDNNEMNGNSMSGTQNSSSGKKPTKLIGIIVGIVVVVAVIVCAVFAFSKNSSVFASKGKKFVKLATSDQKFLQVLKNDKGTSQVNTDLEIKFDELMKAFDYEDQDVGNLLFNSKEIKKGDDYSLNASLSMENIDDAKIELQVAKTGNLVGVNLPNITNKFLAIDTSDIDGLIENLKDLGLLDESFTNEIAEDETSEEMQKELKKLVDKYLDVLGENISDYVEKTSNVNVEIGNYSEKLQNMYLH